MTTPDKEEMPTEDRTTGHWFLPVAADRIELFRSKCTAKLNFSNDAESDGVSLKSDTSSQPASEVRTEVTLQDRLRYGVPQATHTERRRAELQAASSLDDLTDTIREIEKQCTQADDPEHHTLSLVKHMSRNALARLSQPASEAGKLSTDELAYNHRDEADQ